MNQEKSGYNAIIDGVIWKQLLIFFFPILLGSFFQQMYNTVDTIIVGQFAGKLALASVGSTSSFVNLLFGFFVGLASGATVILAQSVGAKDQQGVHDAVHTGIAMSVLGGLAITVLGLILSEPMMRLVRVADDIWDGSLTYLRIFFLGMIPAVVYNVGAGILRALGDSKRPLYFLIAGCLINVVTDLIFVALFDMGVAGAAIATVLSEVISAVMVVVCLMRRQDASRLILKEIRIVPSVLRRILHIGVPGGLQSVMYNISNIIIQSSVNKLGSDTTAAWTATGRADGIIWLIMGAFGTAITTFVGQNFGAQRYDRMRKSTRICMAMAVGSTLAVSAVLVIFARPILSIFSDDQAVLDIGVEIFYAICPFYITYVAVEILSGTIRGTGDTVKPVIFIALCTCLFRVIWVSVCDRLDMGLTAVSLAYGSSWLLTSCVFIVYYFRNRWLERRIQVMGFKPEIRKKRHLFSKTA